jgi:hypothetical protein
MKKFSRSASLTAIAIALGLALAGCTLPGNVPHGSPPLTKDEQVLGEIDRKASLKGSRMCIINNSSLNMTIFWRGYPDARDIPIGERNCNSGWEDSDSMSDIEGTISYVAAGETGRVRYINVWAENQILYWPHASAMTRIPGGKSVGACGNWSVDETHFIDTGWLHGILTRLPDSDDNKEYELVLTDKIGQPGGDCQ